MSASIYHIHLVKHARPVELLEVVSRALMSAKNTSAHRRQMAGVQQFLRACIDAVVKVPPTLPDDVHYRVQLLEQLDEIFVRVCISAIDFCYERSSFGENGPVFVLTQSI